jgi:organic radical activating enzyme
VAKGYLSEIFVSFQGEGEAVGRRQLFIRLAGCNLRCRYCDTPDSLERSSRFVVHGVTGSVELQNPVTTAEAVAHAMRLLEGEGAVDGVSVTGGEPLVQADFVAELLADARLPRPRLLETNGMLPDRLAAVLPMVDLVSMDIKLPSNTGEPAFWDAHARFLSRGRGKVYVKVLVDTSTDIDEVESAARLVREHAPNTPVFLQPITSPDGRTDIQAGRLRELFTCVRRHVGDVRVLPQTHKILGVE